jgi:osmotically-inducible protein OsmY
MVLAILGFAGLTLAAGCTPQGVVLGVAAKAVTMASEERGFSTAVDDGAIQLSLNGKYFATDEKAFQNVYVTVREGRVLLSGSVPQANVRVDAVRLAWEVEGVREVLSELTTDNDADLIDYGRDVWLANKMETVMLFDSEVQSINFSIDVVDGTLFIMGIAQDQVERNRVLAHARGLPHVRRIVDYTRLRADPLS